jgi:hypothetical protein
MQSHCGFIIAQSIVFTSSFIITFLVERLGSYLLKHSVISLNAFGNRHQAATYVAMKPYPAGLAAQFLVAHASFGD